MTSPVLDDSNISLSTSGGAGGGNIAASPQTATGVSQLVRSLDLLFDKKKEKGEGREKS